MIIKTDFKPTVRRKCSLHMLVFMFVHGEMEEMNQTGGNETEWVKRSTHEMGEMKQRAGKYIFE